MCSQFDQTGSHFSQYSSVDMGILRNLLLSNIISCIIFIEAPLWFVNYENLLSQYNWQTVSDSFVPKEENIGKSSFNSIKNCKFDINKLEKNRMKKQLWKIFVIANTHLTTNGKNTHKSTINSSCYAYLQNWLQWIGLNWIQVIFGEIFPFIEI